MWTLAVGLTGFLCGFGGPMILAPESNQGPLVGLFLTGPVGAVLGVVLGTVMRLLRVRQEVSILWLAGTCIAVGGATLYLVTPQPRLDATIVEVEVRGCVPALEWRDRAVADWERRLARPGWRETEPRWREHFERTAIGSVVSATTNRHRQVWMGQAPWNKGQRWATGWVPGAPALKRGSELVRSGEYYSSQPCAKMPDGWRGTFVAKASVWEGRNPPLDPHGVLNMADLLEVSQSLAALIR